MKRFERDEHGNRGKEKKKAANQAAQWKREAGSREQEEKLKEDRRGKSAKKKKIEKWGEEVEKPSRTKKIRVFHEKSLKNEEST